MKIARIVSLCFAMSLAAQLSARAEEAKAPSQDPACELDQKQFLKEFENARAIHTKMAKAPNFQQFLNPLLQKQNALVKSTLASLGWICSNSKSANPHEVPLTWTSGQGQCDAFDRVSKLNEEAFFHAFNVHQSSKRLKSRFPAGLTQLKAIDETVIAYRAQGTPGAYGASEKNFPVYDREGLKKEIKNIYDNPKTGLKKLETVVLASEEYNLEREERVSENLRIADGRYRSCKGLSPYVSTSTATSTRTRAFGPR